MNVVDLKWTIYTDIEAEFKQQLRSLVPKVLSGSNIVVKEINGQKVTCRELLEYFRVCLHPSKDTLLFTGLYRNISR